MWQSFKDPIATWDGRKNKQQILNEIIYIHRFSSESSGNRFSELFVHVIYHLLNTEGYQLNTHLSYFYLYWFIQSNEDRKNDTLFAFGNSKVTNRVAIFRTFLFGKIFLESIDKGGCRELDSSPPPPPNSKKNEMLLNQE